MDNSLSLPGRHVPIIKKIKLNMRHYFENLESQIDLKTLAIFNDLTEAEYAELGKCVSLTRFKKNTVVYHEGSHMGGMYVVLTGILKVYKTGYDGKEQIIRFAKAGDPIAYRSILCGEPACTTAETLYETSLCYVPAEQLTKLIHENNNFAIPFLRLACSELGESNSFLLDLAQKTVRERLAEVLLILMETFGIDEENRLKIALTREDLANMVGTATESVIRLLSEFKADKLIELQGRYIKMLNIPQLLKIGNVRV